MPLVAAPPSRISALFAGGRDATTIARLGESGHLRLRALRSSPGEAILVNTAGGIVGGDRLEVEIAARGAGTAATIGTAAAEKCYRSAGSQTVIATALDVGSDASLDWLPQETILFDGACVRRSLRVDLAISARFLAVETIVFGRLASGETMTSGSLRESWRVRRAGRLIFADESRILAPIDATLDRPALGGGARAVSLLLASGEQTETRLETVRAALAAFTGDDAPVHGGASLRDGVLVARMLSISPARLRACLVATLGIFRRTPLPRTWS